MKTSAYIYLLCSIVGTLLSTSSVVAKKNENDVSTDKIRAGYMSTKDIDILPVMAQNGMNTAIVKFGWLSVPLSPQQRGLLFKWAEACQQTGLYFMPAINLWGAREPHWIQPQHYLYYREKEFNKTPCPLEDEVYKLAVHKRVLELARLSLSIPITGVVIDLEMYGANILAFPEYCVCDYCFERFLGGRSVSEPLAANKRQNYLVKSKQTEAYRTFTTNYIAQMAQKTKQQLEVISPNFMIGAFNLDLDKNYNKGLLKGLGSGSKPALVFTEMTYSTGYSDYIPEQQRRFSDVNTNAQLVVGIWQDKFPSENLAEQYYHCAKASAGYWIYSMESFSKHSNLKPLPFDKNRYLQAIREANNELDKLAIAPKYKSFLKIRSFVTPKRPVHPKSLIIPPVEYVTAFVKSAKPVQPLTFRYSNRLVFLAQKGETLEFEASFRKASSKYARDYAVVMLTTCSGKIIARDEATIQRNGYLKAVASYNGTYVIALESGNQIVKLVKASHPYSIYVSDKTELLKPKQPFFLWKPGGSDFAKVTFQADGTKESFTAIFKNESGKVLGRYDIFTNQTVSVPLGHSSYGEIIELSIKPRSRVYFEDVYIRVESGLEKYISPVREAVVKASLR